MIAAEMGLVDLVAAFSRGCDPDLRDNWGRAPFQLALRPRVRGTGYATGKIGPLYEMLAPSCLKVKVGGAPDQAGPSHDGFFLLNSMLAVFQYILRHKIEWQLPAFETGDFTAALRHFLNRDPERRRTREYITAYLPGTRSYGPNPCTGIFLRVHRGLYIPNPAMDVEVQGSWTNFYDVINLEMLEQEKEETGSRKSSAIYAMPRTTFQPGAAAPPTAEPSPPPAPQIRHLRRLNQRKPIRLPEEIRKPPAQLSLFQQ